MEVKLLDLNVDKSCYILIGSEKCTESLRNNLSRFQLILCGNEMKEKMADKYLGDMLCHKGLGSSAHATIMDRYSQVSAGKVDCRSKVVVGISPHSKSVKQC